METSQDIGALCAALSKAQSEIKNPPLDSKNPHYGNRYASLAAHLEAARTPLAKQELTLTQHLGYTDGRVCVTSLLSHSSGQWMRSTVAMPLWEKAKAQDLGSIVTYLRRYAIASLLMLTGEEDEDAEHDRNTRSGGDKSAGQGPEATAGRSASTSSSVRVHEMCRKDLFTFTRSSSTFVGIWGLPSSASTGRGSEATARRSASLPSSVRMPEMCSKDLFTSTRSPSSFVTARNSPSSASTQHMRTSAPIKSPPVIVASAPWPTSMPKSRCTIPAPCGPRTRQPGPRAPSPAPGTGPR